MHSVNPPCPNRECKDYDKKDAHNIIKNGHDRDNKQRYLCQSCGRTFTHTPPPPLEDWQRKKPTRGRKSQRNQGEYYDEKKEKETLSLTPTAVKRLDELAKLLNVSRSELVERIGRYEGMKQLEGGLIRLEFSLRDTTS